MAKEAALLAALVCTRALLPQVTLLRSFHLSARDRKKLNDQQPAKQHTLSRLLVAAKRLDFPACHHSMR